MDFNFIIYCLVIFLVNLKEPLEYMSIVPGMGI